MSFDRSRRAPTAAADRAGTAAAGSPGKQTLTQQLAMPVQRHAGAGAAPDGPEVHTAAAHGTSGPATALPHLEPIQRSFGRHDVGQVRAHVGGPAAEGAGAMGADAFAVGDRVAFAGAPDLHTAAHEAAHIVQQRAGVQLKGGVGEAGDAYERHADAVADLVVQGKSSEALLDEHAGAGAPSGGGAVQRHVFVKGKQIKKSDPLAKDAIAGMVTDHTVRSYESDDELKRHAAGQTDYLGNLKDKNGTWLRFNEGGLNLLGEDHTLVSLRDVIAAVGATSFIDERISRDQLADGSQLKSAYETETADTFKKFGIEGEADKHKFGAESLFPKMGFVMSELLPFLGAADDLQKLTKAKGYRGQPFQRYLKMAWAHGKDVKAKVSVLQAVNRPVSRADQALAQAVERVEADVDAFVTALPVDGWLGDALVQPGATPIVRSLSIFARVFVDAMVARVVADPASRMTAADKAKHAGPTTSQEKSDMFSKVRDFQIQDAVKDAAGRNVRYAGMGLLHLGEMLDTKTLPPNSKAYFMVPGADLTKFQKETERLRKLAVNQ